MTRKQRIEKEIDFADLGAGAYLYCSLWDMMEDRDLTWEDFEHKTKTWKRAVRDSLCEPYEYTTYEDVWEKIICTSFLQREEQGGIAKETAENIKTFLLAKIEKYWDETVMVFSDDLKKQEKPHQAVRLSELVGSGHELSIRDMDFDNLITDGLVFNSEGRIEQGCGKEDCCQSN